MKFKISPKCQIGPMKFRIVFDEYLMHKMDLSAYCNSREEVICLSTGRSAEQTFTSLIHEIFHICNDESGNSLEEGQVVGIAYLLSQAILSLGIEPDFSEIPGD